jgi:hypothetical protein
MRFFDDGRVLYSLDTVEPDDMIKHLKKGIPIDKRVYEGKYTVTRREVNVEVIHTVRGTKYIMDTLTEPKRMNSLICYRIILDDR